MTSILIITIIILLFIFYKLYDSYLQENYVNSYDYYCNDWNDPYNIKKINKSLRRRAPCKYCTYSLDCDLSDDSLPGCVNSYDKPIKINKMRQNRNI